MPTTNGTGEQKVPRPYSHTATTDKVLALLAQQPLTGKRFLDLGAGEGYLTDKLCKLLHTHGQRPEECVTACDLYPETFLLPEIECAAADFNDRIPFEEKSFDFIVCQEVIEHIPNQQHLFEEIFRLLRPGGKAWITTPIPSAATRGSVRSSPARCHCSTSCRSPRTMWFAPVDTSIRSRCTTSVFFPSLPDSIPSIFPSIGSSDRESC